MVCPTCDRARSQLLDTKRSQWSQAQNSGRINLDNTLDTRYGHKQHEIGHKRDAKTDTDLNVEVLYVQRIVLDELATLFNVFAHERSEDFVGFDNVFELDLEQGPVLGVHGGFP